MRRGDTLRTTREIAELRRSVSKPDRRTVRTCVTVLNHRDETLMTYDALVRFGREIPFLQRRDLR